MDGADQESTPDQPSREGCAPPRRDWVLLPGAAAIAYLILTIHAAYVETPTVDEFAHVPAGCAYWNQGRTDLYCKSPPTLRYWMTLPVILDPAVSVPEVIESSWDWGPWQYGARFMNANQAHYLGSFFRARMMIIVLGLGTGALLFVWARALFGIAAASTVTTVFFLSPTVLAHAHLATTDVGCMFSVFLSLFALRWAYQQPRWWRLLIAGAALGLALSIKFTALLLPPVVAGLVLLHRFRSPGWKRGSAVWAAARDLVALFAVALLTINLCMSFEGTLRPLREYTFSSSFCKKVQMLLPGALPVPLPEHYVVGFDGQKMDAESGEFGSYLMGRWSQDGWWYYNLVALGVKLPVPTLGMILVGAGLWLRSRRDVCERWTVLLPAGVLLVALSLLSRLNLGVRYLLPALPFLLLLSGALWVRTSTSAKRWLRYVPLPIVAYYAVAAAAAHPSYLSFFNLAAGGPDRSHHWLVDSNLDWGQDLYRVSEAARRLKGDAPIQLLYFGHVAPELYGIRYTPLSPHPVEDVIAISMNYLVGSRYVAITTDGRVLHVRRDYARWLQDHTPVERLGSILIFDTRTANTTPPR